MANKHEVGRAANTPKVTLFTVTATIESLGGTPFRKPCLGHHLSVIESLRHVKINDFDSFSVFCYENVIWLYISVTDSLLMQMLQSF
jgi:hypothetical protein